MHATDTDLARLYDEHFPLLVDLAVSNGVPPEEAEDLAHDVLVASIVQLSRINDFSAWVTSALSAGIASRDGGVHRER